MLNRQPERLTEVPGIGEVKAAAIVEGYQERRELADTVLALQAFDISSATAMKLYQVYGSDAADKVRENPYQLIEDVFGIGFQKADRIAQSMGITSQDPHRIRSGILYNLGLEANGGNTYALRKPFCEQTARMLDVSLQELEEVLYTAILQGDLYADVMDGAELLYLDRFYRAEQRVAGKMLQLAHAGLSHLTGDLEGMIRRMETDRDIQLSKKQKQAILTSLQNGVCVITGGPGTGKTTIIDAIMYILTSNGIRTALAAPTGRAAKRMSQTTGYDASTIHRLLEYF
ncbi:MAG TPA: ATP-dependent RecD-like DNA helicase, partial [Clostridiales bacterium]|nr:ATP-dependent RecD-like DNA helicase [Clostridiales bacterium]